MKAHAEEINYEVAIAREKEVRHDVMSHVYAYGVQCPAAKGIIHLGATSCYVGDNTDLIVMTEALKLVRSKLINVIAELAKFADRYKAQPTLAFTHFQPAQPTTVGKRATLWMMELKLDLDDLDYLIGSMRPFGLQGNHRHPGQLPGAFLTATMRNAAVWTSESLRRWAFPAATRYPARPIPARWTAES